MIRDRKDSRDQGLQGSRGRDTGGLCVTMCAALAAWALVAGGPAGAKGLTAKQILDRSTKHYNVIKDYTADAKLTVESEMIHIPEMRVKIYFKKPDNLRIASKDGFAVLPKQGVILGNPLRELMGGSKLSLRPSERVLNADCYVISNSSQREGHTVQSTAWVDKKDFLVRQIRIDPEGGPSVKIKLWYSRVARKYWLPATTTAQISPRPLPGAGSEGSAKTGRLMIVTIKFRNYRVNTGLDDNIFEE